MSAINQEQFKKLSAFIDSTKLTQLMNDFFDPDSSGKNRLLQSLRAQEHKNILQHAHFIKGSSSFLGMQKIYDLCVFIEKEIKENPEPRFEILLNDFEYVWQTSHKETQILLKNLPAPKQSALDTHQNLP
jgi:HPt (histidine-containing phosphotransfer) domain-containing protein